MNRNYRFAVFVMAAWLVLSIVLSWASILDDALIHLRYADNLLHTHYITYDGIHPDYGVSSLLYVFLLAFLRNFILSPNLPRAVSSAFHLLLFAGVAIVIAKSIPRQAFCLRLLGLVLLLVLVVPASIRWLDDGMETSLVMCLTALISWAAFRESNRPSITPLRYAALVLLGFLTVLLRTELSVLCAIAFAALTLKKITASSSPNRHPWITAALQSSHLLFGNLLALAFIFLTMHALLPDTAVAKSHGITVWFAVLISAAHAFAGGFSFGVGMLLLWLLTLFFLMRARQITLPILFVNAVFPLTLFLATIRGQEIQGIRYLIWTLIFSVLWNLMELGTSTSEIPLVEPNKAGRVLAYALIALVLLELPFETRELYPIISGHAKLMKILPTQHLDVLQDKLGIAADVGVIGYFSKARICDLSGLIDGRKFASMNFNERVASCIAQKPGFLFLNRGQYDAFSVAFPSQDWQVCGAYEMNALHYKDIHYLIVPHNLAPQICSQTSGDQPYPVSHLIDQPDASIETP
jgi:hypothetical protein